MKKVICALIFVFGLFTVGHAITKEEIAKLPHITAKQAYAWHKMKQIVLIDTHDFEQSNILGTHYIPLKVIEKAHLKINKNAVIGVFCA